MRSKLLTIILMLNSVVTFLSRTVNTSMRYC